jgi:hypothetical protein
MDNVAFDMGLRLERNAHAPDRADSLVLVSMALDGVAAVASAPNAFIKSGAPLAQQSHSADHVVSAPDGWGGFRVQAHDWHPTQ